MDSLCTSVNQKQKQLGSLNPHVSCKHQSDNEVHHGLKHSLQLVVFPSTHTHPTRFLPVFGLHDVKPFTMTT